MGEIRSRGLCYFYCLAYEHAEGFIVALLGKLLYQVRQRSPVTLRDKTRFERKHPKLKPNTAPYFAAYARIYRKYSSDEHTLHLEAVPVEQRRGQGQGRRTSPNADPLRRTRRPDLSLTVELSLITCSRLDPHRSLSSSWLCRAWPCRPEREQATQLPGCEDG